MKLPALPCHNAAPPGPYSPTCSSPQLPLTFPANPPGGGVRFTTPEGAPLQSAGKDGERGKRTSPACAPCAIAATAELCAPSGWRFVAVHWARATLGHTPAVAINP